MRPPEAPLPGAPAGPRASDAPFLGVGVGLRTPHASEILERAERGALRVDWLEAISENHMVRGGARGASSRRCARTGRWRSTASR